jgi:putative acetyltransferase
MKIQLGNLDHNAVKALLLTHHQEMLKHSPQESVHALDLASLKADNITFYTAWIDDQLAGCAALKKLNNHHAEIKSMRTSHQFLRKGIAAKLLTHLLTEAEKQHYSKVSLETGTKKAFLPAQKLYENVGFKVCPPFDNYKEDPYSMFMTKNLSTNNITMTKDEIIKNTF